jgi:hypothetical protein
MVATGYILIIRVRYVENRIGVNKKQMIFFNLKDCKIVDASKSSGSRYWIEHPQNDAILASCDTEAEAQIIISELNELSKKFQ